MTTHRVGDERTVLEYQLEAQRGDLAALFCEPAAEPPNQTTERPPAN